ncbi:MAG: PLD nuclease N-terminal domain-containing protein [Microbacteriaceae bacterium]
MILYLVYVVAIILVLVDVITRDNSLIRFLPKATWVFIVVILPLIGTVLWFTVGREYGQRFDVPSFGDPRRTEAAMAPDWASTEAQMAALDAEIEFFEKQDRIKRLEAELKARGGDPVS